jgi:hypothetical protein
VFLPRRQAAFILCTDRTEMDPIARAARRSGGRGRRPAKLARFLKCLPPEPARLGVSEENAA